MSQYAAGIRASPVSEGITLSRKPRAATLVHLLIEDLVDCAKYGATHPGLHELPDLALYRLKLKLML
jgi:hypothetical protein